MLAEKGFYFGHVSTSVLVKRLSRFYLSAGITNIHIRELIRSING